MTEQEQEGWDAASHAAPKAPNPYPAGTPENEAWQSGWDGWYKADRSIPRTAQDKVRESVERAHSVQAQMRNQRAGIQRVAGGDYVIKGALRLIGEGKDPTQAFIDSVEDQNFHGNYPEVVSNRNMILSDYKKELAKTGKSFNDSQWKQYEDSQS